MFMSLCLLNHVIVLTLSRFFVLTFFASPKNLITYQINSITPSQNKKNKNQNRENLIPNTNLTNFKHNKTKKLIISSIVALSFIHLINSPNTLKSILSLCAVLSYNQNNTDKPNHKAQMCFHDYQELKFITITENQSLSCFFFVCIVFDNREIQEEKKRGYTRNW